MHACWYLTQFAALALACVGANEEVIYDNVVSENCMASFIR